MSSFEERDNQAVICPYCGSKDGDAWERQREEGTNTCDDCGKKFNWRREVHCEYITSGDCELNNELHEFEEHEHWIMDKKNDTEEFRIRDCKKCAEYKVDRRPKDNG